MLQVFPVDTDVEKSVQAILSVFATEARKLSIKLAAEFGPNIRRYQWIRTDPVRFGQIVSLSQWKRKLFDLYLTFRVRVQVNNLVSNAIRFTATSQIRNITVRVDVSLSPPLEESCVMPEAQHDHQHFDLPMGSPIYIYCEVADSGPGLAPEQLQLLFKRFSQGDSATHVV